MKKLYTIIIMMAMAIMFTVPVSAATKLYSINNSNTRVYSNAGLSSGSGWIYGSDEITLNQIVNSNVCKVTYPVSKGTKTGYISRSAVLTCSSAVAEAVSRAKITTYKRPGGASYGYIAVNDRVKVFGTYGNYTQVQYPVSGGYKIAFITTQNCNTYILNNNGNATLNSLMNQYVGTYWTTDGKPSDSEGKTSRYYFGIQCKGFAGFIFNELFHGGYIGQYDGSKYYIPNPCGAYEVGKIWNVSTSDLNPVRNLLSKGQPGDFIQVRRRGKSWGHSMILVSKSSNGITVFDCNSDGHCAVKKYFVSWQDFANKNVGVSLYHSTNYHS